MLPIQLDVTDRTADFAAVDRAFEHFGRMDVVVNNAGYGLFGAIEELTEAEIRDQIETNLFGALWVTQAALPHLRAQGSGHIIQVSSIGGIAAFPNIGGYHASKWALEGFSEALSAEVAGFGNRGNPDATGPAILKIVDAETPPLRIFFGQMPTVLSKQLYADRLATWAQWEDVSLQAQGSKS